MKKVIYAIMLVSFLSVFVFGCDYAPNPIDVSSWNISKLVNTSSGDLKSSSIATLYAGKNINVGIVSIKRDLEKLYVTFSTNDGWVLSETHLAMSKDLTSIPQTKKGNPKPGKFSYKESHYPAIESYTYEITMPSDYEVGTKIYVAAHAEVINIEEDYDDNDDDDVESAWAGTYPFPGKNWAAFFLYEINTIIGYITYTNENGIAYFTLDDNEIYCLNVLDENNDPLPNIDVTIHTKENAIFGIISDPNGNYLPNILIPQNENQNSNEYSILLEPITIGIITITAITIAPVIYVALEPAISSLGAYLGGLISSALTTSTLTSAVSQYAMQVTTYRGTASEFINHFWGETPEETVNIILSDTFSGATIMVNHDDNYAEFAKDVLEKWLKDKYEDERREWKYGRSLEDERVSIILEANELSAIQNGDFSQGLSGWTFNDLSDAHCYKTAYAEANVESGRLKVQAHYWVGYGVVSQLFESYTPNFLEFDFDLITSSCSGGEVTLMRGLDSILTFRTNHAPPFPANHDIYTTIWFNGGAYHLESPENNKYIKEGKLSLLFDYEQNSVMVFLDGGERFAIPVPIGFNMNVDTIQLKSLNGCCDGRDHTTTYFDNVVLF